MSGLVKDETGNEYDSLKVLRRDTDKKSTQAYWICRCKCGNLVSIDGGSLRQLRRRDCGQCRSLLNENVFKQIKKKSFGRLKIIDRVKRKHGHRPKVLVKCSCGIKKELYYHRIISGDVRSCGCSENKKRKKSRQVKFAKSRWKPPRVQKRIKKSVCLRYYEDDQTYFILKMGEFVSRIKKELNRFPTDPEILEEAVRIGYRKVG